MNEVTSLVLRRIRKPLILIVLVYAIAIIGLTLIPGLDDKGNVWHMDIFHAFYFVSYTATTIGFGEIPYPLTEGQRLWSLLIIYLTVISWFYTLGTIVALIQNKNFQSVVKESAFKRDVKNMNRPYYIVCGLGETGKAVVEALLEEHFGAVVIEKKDDISERSLSDTLEYVPHLTADASTPEVIEKAGVQLSKCHGVIALTSSDETNLKIAISSKLLHPNINVVCRSEYKEHEENMLSFGTNHIINPFDSFASIFRMALHSPSMHLIYEWLTGSSEVSLSTPIDIKEGHWILLGYGRFGQQLHEALREKNIRTVVIDPKSKTKSIFENNRHPGDSYISGTGTDAVTLTAAGIDTAAGIIAGSNNDSNNLSIIMTARQLNKHVFVIGRQNYKSNAVLYSKINEHYDKETHKNEENIFSSAHIVVQPSEIIARKIRAILIAPLLVDFINHSLHKDEEWANITISRLSAVIGDNPPHIWTVTINKEETPAIAQALGFGRSILLKHIIQDPVDHSEILPCIPLLLKRGDDIQLLPKQETEIKAFDQLLFCALREIKYTMSPTLIDLSSLNYVMTSKNEPQSYLWKKISRYLQKEERRNTPRQH